MAASVVARLYGPGVSPNNHDPFASGAGQASRLLLTRSSGHDAGCPPPFYVTMNDVVPIPQAALPQPLDPSPLAWNNQPKKAWRSVSQEVQNAIA